MLIWSCSSIRAKLEMAGIERLTNRKSLLGTGGIISSGSSFLSSKIRRLQIRDPASEKRLLRIVGGIWDSLSQVDPLSYFADQVTSSDDFA
jgi:hypothetical protein